jgi:hypothetical protein
MKEDDVFSGLKRTPTSPLFFCRLLLSFLFVKLLVEGEGNSKLVGLVNTPITPIAPETCVGLLCRVYTCLQA